LVYNLPYQHLPMSEAQTPFDSIESAHEYVTLLAAQLDGVQAAVAEDFAEAQRETAGRRLDALRLVDYKLAQLTLHLSAAGRILNDLRALRRLLLGERDTVTAVTTGASHPVQPTPAPRVPAPDR
jgi:hypothetical protein